MRGPLRPLVHRPADRTGLLLGVVLLAWLAGCNAPASEAERARSPTGESTPPPPAGKAGATDQPLKAAPLGHASEVNSRAASMHFDAAPGSEVVIADAYALTVLDATKLPATVLASTPALGGANAAATGDIDGDGRDDVVVGWGAHRDHPAATIRVVAYRAQDGKLVSEDILAAPDSTRAQVSSLQVTQLVEGGPRGVLVAHYVDKYDVRAVWVSRNARGDWSARTLGEQRMATLWRAGKLGSSTREIAVGRPYGDVQESFGDVTLRSGGAERGLATYRGVRSLEFVELGGGDERATRLCYSDGWHWEYRKRAAGLLSCAFESSDVGTVTQLVHDSDGTEFNTLASADLDADGKRELIALGDAGLFSYTPSPANVAAPTWARRKLGPAGYDFAVIPRVTGDAIVLAGEQPLLLRAAAR